MKFVLVEKVFLLLLVVIILFTAYRIIHTHTVLENTNSPTKVVHIFDLNNDLLYNIVTIFSMILLLLSNIFFWRTGRGIFFLWSVLYFMGGIIALAILENARFYYIKQYGIWHREFSSGFVVSVYLISIVIIIATIDYLIIKRLRNKALFKLNKSEHFQQ
jgi:uncharacterized membrane protein